MRQQDYLMLFDPAFGSREPYPSHAQQYRDYHGGVAWIYNPWSGKMRHPSDIGSDIYGVLIIMSNQKMNKYPNHITSLGLHNLLDSEVEINGKLQPCRPMPYYGSVFRRIRLAWWVFIGKADALTWHGQ